MPPILVGCCGWPIRRAEYFSRLKTVEINSAFYNLPLLSTAERWRAEAPEDFEFSLKAWQIITHPASSPTYSKLRRKISEKARTRYGGFRDTFEVSSAWERTLAVARALRARFILFQTPSSFYPSSDHLRDMYRFFKGLPRGEFHYVWETRAESWRPTSLQRTCEDLGLVHGVDPLVSEPLHGPVRYFRLHGRYDKGRLLYHHMYSDEQMSRLLDLCRGRHAYVYFNNFEMWRDAGRFERLARESDVRSLRAL